MVSHEVVAGADVGCGLHGLTCLTCSLPLTCDAKYASLSIRKVLACLASSQEENVSPELNLPVQKSILKSSLFVVGRGDM